MMSEQPLDRCDPFDEFVSGAFNVAVPVSVDRQSRTQLNEFRQMLAQSRQPSAGWGLGTNRRLWLGLVATAAACVVAAALIALPARPSTSFAEVVAAARQLPWIHVSIGGAEGAKREVWYSPRNDVSGSRSDDWIEFHDHTLGVHYSYDVGKRVLYRMPEYIPRRSNHYALTAETLRLLLHGERPVGEPVKLMELLGRSGAKLEFIDQSMQKVDQDGQKWLDYHLTIRYSDLPEPVELLFRVDPESKLPRLVRIAGKLNGQPMANETHFNYPENGPASVYELGVPQSAKLVDRFPSDDVVRILEKLRDGRRRMDNYRVLVASRRDGDNYWWLNELPMVIYRKGDNFRVDFAGGVGARAKVDKPADDVDLEKWWWKRAAEFVLYPVYITRGSTTFSITTHVAKRSDGSKQLQVESVKQWQTIDRPGESIPPYYSRQPEFVCRPPLGIPSQVFEPVLDPSPTDGPAGTVLLRVRRAGRVPKAPNPADDKLPPSADVYRFWLDPAREFAVVRWDMLVVGDSGKEEVLSSTVVEQLKQSPKGVWYATRFRVKAVPPVESDQVFDIYVDFDVDLPDSLFEPPKVGDVFEVKGMR